MTLTKRELLIMRAEAQERIQRLRQEYDRRFNGPRQQQREVPKEVIGGERKK